VTKRRILFFSLLLIPLLLWTGNLVIRLVFSQDLGLDLISLILIIPIIFLIGWEMQHSSPTPEKPKENFVFSRIVGPSVIIIFVSAILVILGLLSFSASKVSPITPPAPFLSTLDVSAIQTAAVETAFAQIDISPTIKNKLPLEFTSNPDGSMNLTETPNSQLTVIPSATNPHPTASPTQDLTLTDELTPEETDIPEPISLTGTGSDDVNFSKWDGPAVVSVTHDGDGTFELSNYSKTSQKLGTLVSTTGFYVGSLALDFNLNQKSTNFHITASGDWEIQIIPLALARVENIPALIEGDGDDVIEILDTQPDQLKIDASLAEGSFTMWAYNKKTLTLLIKTTAPYSGTLVAPPGTTTIVVTTVGPWSMDTTAR